MIEIKHLEAPTSLATRLAATVRNEVPAPVTFNDPMDEKALRNLADVHLGRHVIDVDAREFFARGGGIHCITQQQPSAI